MRLSVVLAFAFFVSLALASPPAHAQPLTGNDFRIDLSQGLVLAAGRTVGLAGATSAIETGIGGVPQNPASYASREVHQHGWFDYSLAASLSFPGALAGDDFFNNGRGRGAGIDVERSIFVDAGLGLLFGDWGTGMLVRGQLFEARTADDVVGVSTASAHVGLGAALLDGDLVVGVGGRGAFFDVTSRISGLTPIQLLGGGAELGVQWRPDARPWSAALAIRTPVHTRRVATFPPGNDPVVIAGYYLPTKVVMPWELQAGFAYQLGPRPLHQRRPPRVRPSALARAELAQARCEREREQAFVEMPSIRPPDSALVGAPCARRDFPRPSDHAFWAAELERRAEEDRTREAREEALADRIALERQRALDALPRRYLLLTTDLLIQGRVPNAIGLDAFLDQERRPRGERTTVGYRLGVEGEPWRNRMKLRTGTYVEPGRNAGAHARPHFTFGTDLRLFRFSPFGEAHPLDFRVGTNLDVARDYFDIGVGAGFWH